MNGAIEAIAAITAITSVGIFVLVGLKMRFSHLVRMREIPAAENERLTEAVEQLQDEVRSMRGEFADLHERVDFTERILAEGRTRNAIGPRESTPV